MMKELEKILEYMDEHSGVPIAFFAVLILSVMVLTIRATLVMSGEGLMLLIVLYVMLCLIVTVFGWLLESVISGGKDWLSDALGFNSWVMVYFIKGDWVLGSVYHTKESAREWAHKAISLGQPVYGIAKTEGIWRRVIWLR